MKWDSDSLDPHVIKTAEGSTQSFSGMLLSGYELNLPI
jgi:hypothetical protein